MNENILPNNDVGTMESPSRPPSLHMKRADLQNLPSVGLPDDFTLRERTDADNASLAELLQSAFPEIEWTTQKAVQTFVEDPAVHKTLLIMHGERLAATATVQQRTGNDHTGTIHWVGSHPDYRGRRLGYAASLAVLHEFARMGFADADLFTDDPRIPAIKTYFNLGFRPALTHPSHEARWNEIAPALIGYLP